MNSLEEYRKLPSDEQESGSFSDRSVATHQKALYKEFGLSLKRSTKKLTTNLLGSFICVNAIVCGTLIGAEISMTSAWPVVYWVAMYWFALFFVALAVLLAGYPTRKKAKFHLEFIHAVERHVRENQTLEVY